MSRLPVGLGPQRRRKLVTATDGRTVQRVLRKLVGPSAMPPALIRARLYAVGYSCETLCWRFAHADGRRMTAADVQQVIDGKALFNLVAGYISDLIDKPVSVLWPGKYPLLEAEQLIERAAVA